MNLSRLAALALSASALLIAQGTAPDRLTVPLSNPGQPATLNIHLVSGSITVTPGAANQVVVESSASSDRERGHRDRDTPPPGMHRIGPAAGGVDIEEDHNVVTVKPESGGRQNLVIQVPVNTSVDLKSVNGGHIDVTGINGDIDVENTNGEVNVKNVSGAVVAHTLNGSVTVSIDRVAPNKPMSFTSLNGTVDVTLPADTKARLRLKTNHGDIFTDFDVKMEPDSSNPVIENNRGSGGRYRIRLDRGVYGSINGGGPEYLFQTLNGSILIHKK